MAPQPSDASPAHRRPTFVPTTSPKDATAAPTPLQSDDRRSDGSTDGHTVYTDAACCVEQCLDLRTFYLGMCVSRPRWPRRRGRDTFKAKHTSCFPRKPCTVHFHLVCRLSLWSRFNLYKLQCPAGGLPRYRATAPDYVQGGDRTTMRTSPGAASSRSRSLSRRLSSQNSSSGSRHSDCSAQQRLDALEE